MGSELLASHLQSCWERKEFSRKGNYTETGKNPHTVWLWLCQIFICLFSAAVGLTDFVFCLCFKGWLEPILLDFPGDSVWRTRPPVQETHRLGFDPWVRKLPWRRKWHPTPVFLPGKSQGQRSLAGYSPWGHEESDTTEQLNANSRVQTSPINQKMWAGLRCLTLEKPICRSGSNS